MEGRFLITVAMATAVFLSGCGGFGAQRVAESGATLEGTVTYGKEKVPAAMIIAKGSSGTTEGFCDDDGKYKLTNVPVGEVTIGVNSDAGKGQLMSRRMAKEAVPKIPNVPYRYTDPTTSGIKTTIAKGENTFNIEIPGTPK
jgi:hypothetical protein